ncbi:hypothetical protein CALVIDRAFT_467001, partial [Calocera viscosa TUFC12733]
DTLIRSIIEEYTAATTLEALRDGICACCAEAFPTKTLRQVPVDDVDFSLLQDPYLPDSLHPLGYDYEGYHRAVLDPKGLSCTNECSGNISLCASCCSSLNRALLPPLALANSFYYAYEHVPDHVKTAFETATFIDRRLVARCSSTKICFRYFDNPESRAYRNGFTGMQHYHRGNVLIWPQDTAELNNVLPPPIDQIKESFVAVFAGGEAPTVDMLRRVEPVKANARVVRTILDFLLSRNKAYTCRTPDFPTGARFSAENFDALFPNAMVNTGPGAGSSYLFPCLKIGHVILEGSQVAVESDVAGRNSYDDSVIGDQDFFLEASGYSVTERSTASYQSMKADALAHCLDKRGAFLLSRKGSQAIHDLKNEFTLTWMFPHLDPFALGGFDDPRRRRPVSMEKQLGHLLRLADRRFQRDASFAFVFHNILQKRETLRKVRFRIPEGRHCTIVENISHVDPEVLAKLARKLEKDRWIRPSNPEEQLALRVLRRVHMLRDDVPGSDAYKRCRRNEIRSLVYRLGSPAFFITLTPSDIDGWLCQLAIDNYQESEFTLKGTTNKTRFRRAMRVAENPAIAAKVFHESMVRFRDIVLRVQNGAGLFG